MELKRADLIAALERVKPGLANKEMIEQSTSFAFVEGRVVTYNDELSISHPIPGLDITGAVEAKPLYDLLKRLTKDTVKVRVTEDQLRVSGGRGRAKLTLHEEVRLPLEEVGEAEDWLELSDPRGLLDALKFAHRSCSRDMSRPVLTCVHVADGYVEASDNYRISRVDIDDGMPDACLIPASAVRVLLAYDVTHMAMGTGWAHFSTSDDTLFHCRVYQGEFPDISGLLELAEGDDVDLSGLTADAIDRSMIFAEREYELDEEVRITIGGKKMKISSKADFGEYEETLSFGEDEPHASFAIHPALLKDILTQSTHARIGGGRLKFSGEGWEHVIALRMDG